MAQRERILNLVREHDRWRSRECLNLIPSENAMSPVARGILSSDIEGRYTLPIGAVVHGELVENAYCGTRYIDELEGIAEGLSCEVFGARHACLRPISGHVAALTTLIALCRPGDTLLTIAGEMGGYDGYLPGYMPAFLGLEAVTLPHKGFELDYGACGDLIRARRPRLVVLGASVIPFPFDVGSLREACSDVGALICYDASHVLGLIAGKAFQDPLAEGADVVVSSTHKSFFGPQGGLVLTNDGGINESVRNSMTWKTLDNAHWGRIAATAYVLLEFREFGEDYARQVVRNARSLARHLDLKGVPTRFRERGYTESHQVLIDTLAMRRQTGLPYPEIATRLEQANIIVDCIGRLGTQEVTRYGMREGEMRAIAEFVSRVLDGEDPESVRGDVLALREGFQEVRYTLDLRGPEAKAGLGA